jgi:hypothetical protein
MFSGPLLADPVVLPVAVAEGASEEAARCKAAFCG